MKKPKHIPGITPSDKPANTSGPAGDRDVFLVPENFFSRLEQQINEKAGGENNKVRMLRMKYLIPGTAAAVLLVAALTVTFMLLKNSEKIISAQPGDEDIIAYLHDEATDNSSELFDQITEMNESGDLNVLPDISGPEDSIRPASPVLPAISDTSLSREDILEYLSEEEFSPEDL